MIDDIRNTKAEQISIESNASIHIDKIEAKVAKPPYFKGLIEKHAADIEFVLGFGHRTPPGLCSAYTIF
jgi:hypothetical protein